MLPIEIIAAYDTPRATIYSKNATTCQTKGRTCKIFNILLGPIFLLPMMAAISKAHSPLLHILSVASHTMPLTPRPHYRTIFIYCCPFPCYFRGLFVVLFLRYCLLHGLIEASGELIDGRLPLFSALRLKCCPRYSTILRQCLKHEMMIVETYASLYVYFTFDEIFYHYLLFPTLFHRLYLQRRRYMTPIRCRSIRQPFYIDSQCLPISLRSNKEDRLIIDATVIAKPRHRQRRHYFDFNTKCWQLFNYTSRASRWQRYAGAYLPPP